MKYKYHSFLKNRSKIDAIKIFKQRLSDAKYIFEKYNQDFLTRNCPYCNSTKYSKFDEFHGMYGICKCEKCNSIFVNPVPPIKALSDYYENCKCNRQLSRVIKKRYKSNDFINDDRVELVSSQIDKIINFKNNKISILEIGCNNGAFLSKLQKAIDLNYKGYSFELDGVDIDSEAIKNPVNHKLNLMQGLAEDISDTFPNKYDLILHFELIEHLIDPISFVDSIHKMLKSNGIMMFTTPNIHGLDNKALDYNKRRYLAHGIFPPMHLNAFSTQNIVHFLVSNGFMVNHIETPGLLDIDMLALCVDDIDTSVYKAIANLDQSNRALIQALIVEMNMSSHMQCIAVKP